MMNAHAPGLATATPTRSNHRRSLLGAAVLVALSGASSLAFADSAPAADDTLTWHGVTLYGIVDAGVQYATHGTPASDYFVAGTPDILQKNSNGSVTAINGNNLSSSRIGLKGVEDLGGGWSAVFKVESFFNPWSGELTDALKSVTANNGVGLTSQATGIDSSIAGQIFSGAAYVGVSNAQFGTLTFGRHTGLLADGIAKYDPMLASQAFSPIGLSGTAAGGGDTEDRRLDSSIKYEISVSGVHVGVQYQAKSGANVGTTTEAVLGFAFPGGSVDAYYMQKNDAIGAGSLSAGALAGVEAACTGVVNGLACAPIDKAVAGTISDNTTAGVMAKYSFADKAATVSAGYENINFKNPSTLVTAGQMTIGGYILADVNNAAFPSTKTLQIYWAGLKYAITPSFDVTGAYYRYQQNSFSTAHPGCNSATVSSQCSGSENFVSAMGDYHFTKRFDVYAGAMYTSVSGGLGNGYLNTSTIDPTAGFRFTF